MEDENKEIEKNEVKEIKNDNTNSNINRNKKIVWILPALISLLALTVSIFFIANNIGFISIVVSIITSVTGLIKYSKKSIASLVIFVILICIAFNFIVLNRFLMALSSCPSDCDNTISSCE